MDRVVMLQLLSTWAIVLLLMCYQSAVLLSITVFSPKDLLENPFWLGKITEVHHIFAHVNRECQDIYISKIKNSYLRTDLR